MLLSHNLKTVSTFVDKNAQKLLKAALKDAFVIIRVSRPRKSKFGDFRPSLIKDIPSRISVNADLNTHAFLITLIHELAHYYTFKMFGTKVKPHGKEWKIHFHDLLVPFLSESVFPQDIYSALNEYIQNPAASSCVDLNLMRALSIYDSTSNAFRVEAIPSYSAFEWHDGRIFIKGEKLRKRYRCKELKSGKIYLFSPIAVVKPIASDPLPVNN